MARRCVTVDVQLLSPEIAGGVPRTNTLGSAHPLEITRATERALDDELQRQIDPDAEVERSSPAVREEEAALGDQDGVRVENECL
jgi:hypothetical protein